MTRILVVDDDRAFRLSTAALLRHEGHEVLMAEDGPSALAALRAANDSGDAVDLMLLDLRMPGIDGLGVVEALRIWGERLPILIISGVGTVESAVRAMHLGADDFLTKPVEPDLLTLRVSELLAGRPESALRAPPNPGDIVGRAPAMVPFFAALRRVAPTDTSVLIHGETGTGKERAARAVHALSSRHSAPFLAVNCAALREGVLESELFGHVKGAFTGALRDRAGLFEAAGDGTLFLDEIGEISSAMQQRLLRVLQEREVTRVGATRAVKISARVVAATHADLKALVASGRFREDLYYRLAVFPLTLPPLRERRADIPLLALHALADLRARGAGRESLDCSPFAMRLLRAYDWPGNVRQLFSVLEAAAIHADFGRIEAQHLSPEVREVMGVRDGMLTGRYRASAGETDERASITAALQETGGTLARAADVLGMSRTTLWRKMKALGLESAAAEGGDDADATDLGGSSKER